MTSSAQTAPKSQPGQPLQADIPLDPDEISVDDYSPSPTSSNKVVIPLPADLEAEGVGARLSMSICSSVQQQGVECVDLTDLEEDIGARSSMSIPSSDQQQGVEYVDLTASQATEMEKGSTISKEEIVERGKESLEYDFEGDDEFDQLIGGCDSVDIHGLDGYVSAEPCGSDRDSHLQVTG